MIGKRPVAGCRSSHGPRRRSLPSAVHRSGPPVRRTARGEARALSIDGSVRSLSEAMDSKVYEAPSQVAGGEAMPAV